MKRILDEFQFDAEDGSLEKLVAAGEALDRTRQAREIVDQNGCTVTNKYGEVKTHPAVNIQRDFSALFVKIMRELNLSEEAPDSRPPPLKFGGK